MEVYMKVRYIVTCPSTDDAVNVVALEVPAANARVHEATRQACHRAVERCKELGNRGRGVEIH